MFGVEDDSGEPYYCDDINCGACIFDKNNLWHDKRLCGYSRMDWLYSEYKEPKPKLTKQERVAVEVFQDAPDKYYIARNENGALYIYFGIPIRGEHKWGTLNQALEFKSKLFPFITWASGRAWSIRELSDLEVEE